MKRILAVFLAVLVLGGVMAVGAMGDTDYVPPIPSIVSHTDAGLAFSWTFKGVGLVFGDHGSATLEYEINSMVKFGASAEVIAIMYKLQPAQSDAFDEDDQHYVRVANVSIAAGSQIALFDKQDVLNYISALRAAREGFFTRYISAEEMNILTDFLAAVFANGIPAGLVVGVAFQNLARPDGTNRWGGWFIGDLVVPAKSGTATTTQPTTTTTTTTTETTTTTTTTTQPTTTTAATTTTEPTPEPEPEPEGNWWRDTASWLRIVLSILTLGILPLIVWLLGK